MAEHNELYKRAFYYDIALERDVSPDVDFLLHVFHAQTGRRLGSALELACGPGYHARNLAQRGVRMTGLDLSAAMLQLAREKALADGVEVRWLEADMREFSLPEPVDLVFGLFDCLDCLTTDDDLIHHFRTVAKNLVPDGLFVVDVSHPRDIGFDRYTDFHYHGSRDGISVAIRWGVNEPRFDFVTGLSDTEVLVTIDDNGKKSTIHDRATERLLLPAELRLLARISGVLEPVAWYGDFNTDQLLDYSPKSRRQIVVYRKK